MESISRVFKKSFNISKASSIRQIISSLVVVVSHSFDHLQIVSPIFTGGLLQKFDRDTMKFAIKCSYVEITGTGGRAVAKNPITDSGKRNKPGRLKLTRDSSGAYKTFSSTVDLKDYEQGQDELVTVFENGKLLQEYSLEDIRARCDLDLNRVDSMAGISHDA